MFNTLIIFWCPTRVSHPFAHTSTTTKPVEVKHVNLSPGTHNSKFAGQNQGVWARFSHVQNLSASSLRFAPLRARKCRNKAAATPRYLTTKPPSLARCPCAPPQRLPQLPAPTAAQPLPDGLPRSAHSRPTLSRALSNHSPLGDAGGPDLQRFPFHFPLGLVHFKLPCCAHCCLHTPRHT